MSQTIFVGHIYGASCQISNQTRHSIKGPDKRSDRPYRSNENEIALYLHVADYFAKIGGLGTSLDDLGYQMEEDALKPLGFKEEELDYLMVDVIAAVESIAEELHDI